MSDEAESREPAPLRADALRMLATWRDAEGMPRAVKGRVWKRLRTDRSAPAPQRAANWVWAVALAAAVLLVWWGVVAMRQSLRDGSMPANEQTVDERTTSERERAVPGRPDTPGMPAEAGVPAPAIAPTELTPSEPPLQAPPHTDTPRAPTRMGAPRQRDDLAPAVEPPAEPISNLTRERDLIARAWSALADGDPGSALQRAAEHELSFPAGLLAPERRAIAIIARCKRGDRGAEPRARTWLHAEPRSPLAGRVRAACIPTQ